MYKTLSRDRYIICVYRENNCKWWKKHYNVDVIYTIKLLQTTILRVGYGQDVGIIIQGNIFLIIKHKDIT